MTKTTKPPLYGVGDLVLLAGVPEPMMPLMSERIRHWTREGLLEPVDTLLTGTGHHRRFGPDAAFNVLVLNVLADFGVQLAAKKKAIEEALDKLRTARKRWERTKAEGPFWLVIRLKRTPVGEFTRATVEAVAGVVVDDPADDSLVLKVNISLILARLERAGRASEGDR
jgi:hypothetical protein